SLNGAATITVQACGTYTELGATANDGCQAIGGVTIGGDVVDASTVGTYIVTYNITDAQGNTATQVTRTVNVVDTTDPVITCPANILTTNDAGLCSAVVNYSNPTG